MNFRAQTVAGCLVFCLALTTGIANAQDSLTSAIEGGRLILEARPRYESASQAGVADADALTLRTRLGWETAAWHGLTATLEFEDVRALSGDYNDGVPPAEPYATIGDPEGTEVNRAQLAWKLNPHLAFTLGRQRIAFDDERFIGPAGWRQDDQTFDALRTDLTLGHFNASYAYVDHVNRVFSDALDWDGPAHLINAAYAFDDHLKLAGFAYLLDFDGPAAAIAQASATFGVRASGVASVSGVRLEYAGTYAQQEEYGDNPASFDLNYLGASLSASRGPISGRVGYESLEGNGARGFSTPLASLHPFQGWADVFTTTPANGVVDLNASITWRPPVSAPHLSNIALTARFHDFDSENTDADLGEEIDLQATASLTPRLSLLVKHADFDGGALGPADTTRTWVGLEFKL